MLTPRGWWLLVVALLQLVAGVMLAYTGQVLLPLLGLTVLLWVLGEWLVFALRTHRLADRLTVEREVRDDRRAVDTCWAGRSFSVRVTLRLSGRWPLPFAAVEDRLPGGAEVVSGTRSLQTDLVPGQAIELNYRIRCPAPGQVRFDGVRLEVADLQGLFSLRVFLRRPVVLPVLPALADAEGHQRTDKRHNLLLPPGIHRLRRPGSGSELLDLRDYLPGDPPKMIAWKPSARRDKLITKEFESEVPVRCTLLLDTSQAVRVGPPGEQALTRLVEIAAAVTQAAIDTRDLVGLVVCGEDGSTYAAPDRGQRHLVDLLRRLAAAARLAPAPGRADSETMLALAWPLAEEVYPDLLRPAVNRFPAWLPWFAFRPTYLRKVRFWEVILPFLPALSATRRRQSMQRKRLSALLAVRYGLPPGGLGLLLEDDERFATLAQRFLADHQVAYPVPVYDEDGRYLYASADKVKALAAALVRAVARGRDNELFVLLADVFDLDAGQLEPLLKAVRVARARHHQVLLVCPWLPGIPPPRDDVPVVQPAAPGRVPSYLRPGGGALVGASLAKQLRQLMTARYHRSYREVRRMFGRLGVPVIRAGAGEPAQLILDRIDRLRAIRRRR
jgi:uncharacterized protein (DUF58 family)